MRFVAVNSEDKQASAGPGSAGAAAHPDDQRLARPSRRILTGHCPAPSHHRQADGNLSATCPKPAWPSPSGLYAELEERIKQLDAEIARVPRG